MCKARTRHRLVGMAAMLGVGLVGTELSAMGVMSFVALMGIVQVGLDLYQGKPASLKAA
ncbi:hypothetical protein [Adonisia turfae]|nr:hypothetical protein [Adonisia turfae]